jgi:S-adenosyl methyltransferase
VNGEETGMAAGPQDDEPDTGDHPSFDTSVAHVARVYDYWLGGKDNFAVDRAAGDQAIAAYPDIVHSVRANRAFLARAVRFLAGEAGIRQFLDIGTGIPSANNTHEVAQAVAPGARVVYVDNDPTVLAHARALLTSGPAGVTDYIDADLRDTGKILDFATNTLDFSQPVAIMLMTIVHLIPDADDPYAIVARLLDAVPSGSYLAMSHIAADMTPAITTAGQRVSQFIQQEQTYRTHEEVLRFFDGLELAEPGLVRVPEWRPASELEAKTPAVLWGGVGRKP